MNFDCLIVDDEAELAKATCDGCHACAKWHFNSDFIVDPRLILLTTTSISLLGLGHFSLSQEVFEKSVHGRC